MSNNFQIKFRIKARTRPRLIIRRTFFFLQLFSFSHLRVDAISKSVTQLYSSNFRNGEMRSDILAEIQFFVGI